MITLPPRSDRQIPLYVDPEILTRVLTNLISNGIKFSHPGGQIFIEYKFEGEILVGLEIHDQGVGIEPKMQERLFRIDQAESTPGTKGELGTGLGLILCQELMKTMGGTIRYQDSNDQGSCFVLDFPLPEKPYIAGETILDQA